MFGYKAFKEAFEPLAGFICFVCMFLVFVFLVALLVPPVLLFFDWWYELWGIAAAEPIERIQETD